MNTKFAKQVMMILSNLVKKDEKKILGRWNLESCDKKMNHKIDMSNEEHCGPCGQYILDKSQQKNHTPFNISNADPKGSASLNVIR